ncbi:hypothetical protein Q7P35_007055 [Cladosporium inversicolor]
MAERRSSARKATQRSQGEATPDYNVVSQFTTILNNQPTARRRSPAKTTSSASRKRSGGAGAVVTKAESDLGDSIEERLPVSDTLPSATRDKSFEGSDEHDSDLSELGTTPDCPTPANCHGQDTPDLTPQLDVVAEQLSDSVSASDHKPASPSSDHAVSDTRPPNFVENGAIAAPISSPVSPRTTSKAPADQIETTENTSNIPHEDDVTAMGSGIELPPTPPKMTEPTPNGKQITRIVVTRRPNDAPSAQSPAKPLTPSSLRQSGRSRAQPSRFGDLIVTPVELAEQQESEEEEPEKISGDDSPIALKVSRTKKSKASGADAKPARRRQKPAQAANPTQGNAAIGKPTRTKKPASQEILSAENLADDVSDAPVKVTTSRKRKAEATTSTPRKRATKASKTSDDSFEVKPKVRKTPVPRKKKEKTPTRQENALQLPSPPVSTADYLEASGVGIDPDLLQLSRRLTYREPLEKKPASRGKPEVWAPGRQELCETLPYYKSAHSGCYSNGNTIYSFMFDSAGVGREYMDSDVIIARMGGHMESDMETGLVSQKKDHDIEGKQPQSVLNNIVHKNPIVIICGDKNAGAITKMPHRYCALGWFKPTHVWAEKTSTKRKTVTTVRYRFERLDRSKPSWYHPVSSEAAEPADTVALPVKTCAECSQYCPQVYLIDWVCTNPKCIAFWQMTNGQPAPYGDLDYHPGFLLQRTTWERESPPFNLNPGVPQIGQHFGDNLSLVNTKGIVCPDCGRCNSRYMFTHWRCDTPGCRWKLQPKHKIVMPSNLSHTPWDMASDGPSLIKSTTAPAVRTQVKYHSNYKVIKYTIQGIAGAVIVAKANKHVVSEPGGADDMFREMQTVDVGLERRMMRKTGSAESKSATADNEMNQAEEDPVEQPKANDDDDDDDEHNAEAGMRMNAFGMNFGMPYKFIASGDSRSFEEAPVAVRTARSLLNWAQRVFVNDEEGYQDFNEELIFGYMDGQKIKYHDDGEMGLGPRIATLSLGGGATMLLRVKAKYFGQMSNTSVFTYEQPLPLPIMQSSGYTSGFRGKKTLKPCKDTHEGRHAAWEELKELKEAGDGAGFRKRSKEVSKELELKRTAGEPILTFHLTHGDIVIMVGEDVQKFLEHQVEPTGSLRFALTCRTVLGNHLPPDQLPKYEAADAELYNGSRIREDGDGEAVVWD